MPERKTIDRARRAQKQGKSPSTQAGEFVREEIDQIREGMSDVEDYPGPTKDDPEKKGHEGTPRANENMVTPPARPEEESEKEPAERPGGNRP